MVTESEHSHLEKLLDFWGYQMMTMPASSNREGQRGLVEGEPQ